MYKKAFTISSVLLSLHSINVNGQSITGQEPVNNPKISRAVFEEVHPKTEEQIVLNRLLTADELDVVCDSHESESLNGIVHFLATQCSNKQSAEVTECFKDSSLLVKMKMFFNCCSRYFAKEETCSSWLINIAACIYCSKFCENPGNKKALENFITKCGTFLTLGWMLASKFFIDTHYYSNAHIAEICAIPLDVLNESEFVFLKGINFNCNIPAEEILAAETFVINSMYVQNRRILNYLPPDVYQR